MIPVTMAPTCWVTHDDDSFDSTENADDDNKKDLRIESCVATSVND